MNLESARPINLLIAGACLFIIMFGIQATAVIINPILLAVIITIAVLPLPKKLEARGMSNKLALVLTILAVVGTMLAIILLFVFGLYRLSLQLPTYATSIAARSQEFAAWYEGITGSTPSTIDSQQISGMATDLVGKIANMVVQVGMTLLIFVFMISAAIAAPPSMQAGLASAAPTVDRVSDYTRDVRKYLTVTTVINMLVGLADALMLFIIGVDFPVLWGLLAWFLGYIPTVGFWLALIPPTILAWAEFGAPTAFVVFLGFVLINGSVQNFVQPKMMGDNLNLSPVVVFLSLFIWGWLLGGIGAILAVPLTLLIITVLESFEITRGMVKLMRPPSASDTTEDEEERRQARQMLGGLLDRGRSVLGNKPAEDKNTTPAINERS